MPHIRPSQEVLKAWDDIESEAKNKQRDSRGLWIKGCKGGPGNPNMAKTAKIKRLVDEAITDEDIKSIYLALLQKAVKGDIKAAELVLDRKMGKIKPDDESIKERLTEVEEKVLKRVDRELGAA